MADNKWTKPTNPPPPLFLGRKERNLVKQVNDELLERVIGQPILYLPISMEYSNFHPLYGEAIEKCFLPPVRIYALVDFEAIETTTENFGLDKMHTINVKFHERRLQEDQDMYVREGDYVQYGSSFYEIVTLTEDRPLFGQVEHLFQIIAKCVRTRRGIMDMSVLDSTTAATLLSEAAAGEQANEAAAAADHEHSVVRVTYSFDSVGEIAKDTGLNSYLGFSGPILLSNSAVYLNGSRQEFAAGEDSGAEYYLEDGMLFSNYTINNGERILLEVLTLV